MKIYLIGIKGSGMAALATILQEQGNTVTGSDVQHVFFTDAILQEKGIKYHPFKADNITKDLDLIIIGNAFNNDNIEVARAKELGLNTKYYYEVVNELATNPTYKSLAICGTNGKTTTTGIVRDLLADHPINYLIGDGTGGGKENAEFFIFEACEYKRRFINYHPNYILINNIEMDHPDYFQDLDDVISAYQEFASHGKTVIINGDDENAMKIEHQNIFRFGLKDTNDVYANEIEYLKTGTKFKLHYQTQIVELEVPYFGEYMIYNLLGAIASLLVMGIELTEIIANSQNFAGVKRRFNEYVLDEKSNVYLVDDYAHHPTSIKLVLKAIRQKYPDYTVTTIFQAHTFSRVNEFKEGFAKELAQSDRLYIAEVFGSIREQNKSASREQIIELIDPQSNVELLERIEDVSKIRENHLICLIGAGDIDKLYLDKLKGAYND